jgi:hypothetical protein
MDVIMDVGHAAVGAGSVYYPLMVNEEGIGWRRNVRMCGPNDEASRAVNLSLKGLRCLRHQRRGSLIAAINSSAEIAEEERRCTPGSLGCHGSSPLAHGLYPNHSSFEVIRSYWDLYKQSTIGPRGKSGLRQFHVYRHAERSEKQGEGGERCGTTQNNPSNEAQFDDECHLPAPEMQQPKQSLPSLVALSCPQVRGQSLARL